MMVSAFITYSPKTIGLESSFLRELKTSYLAEHHFHACFLLTSSSKGLDFAASWEENFPDWFNIPKYKSVVFHYIGWASHVSLSCYIYLYIYLRLVNVVNYVTKEPELVLPETFFFV